MSKTYNPCPVCNIDLNHYPHRPGCPRGDDPEGGSPQIREVYQRTHKLRSFDELTEQIKTEDSAKLVIGSFRPGFDVPSTDAQALYMLWNQIGAGKEDHKRRALIAWYVCDRMEGNSVTEAYKHLLQKIVALHNEGEKAEL